MDFILNIIIILLALAGFILAYYIHSTKKAPETLVCPLDGSCEVVITSEFSHVMGLPVEVGGMLYYLMVFLVYGVFAFVPSIVPLAGSYIMIGVSGTAFLFSVYLTLIQAFKLKHWCTWCLCSAGISTFIFILVTYGAHEKVEELLHTLLHSI